MNCTQPIHKKFIITDEIARENINNAEQGLPLTVPFQKLMENELFCNSYYKVKKKAYRQSHADEIKAKQKAYYQSHADEIKAKQKAYRQSHADEIKAKQKAYRQSHADEIKAHYKAYYQRPEIKAKQKAYYRRTKKLSFSPKLNRDKK